MATTTNYGWVTPDDTDLVKDGAAAIRTLGSSADTTTKNLNPETTLGDLSFRSATSNVNTRIPIGSSGQHLTVVAGVPAWSTASDQTPLTTKGDLFTFSTVDARLAVGTDGQVLTADSNEATGLKFATPAAGSGANWSLLNSGGTALTGAATITVSGISGKSQIMVLVQSASANADAQISVRLNTDSGNNYVRLGASIAANSPYTVNDYTTNVSVAANTINLAKLSSNGTSACSGYVLISGCNASGLKMYNSVGFATPASGSDHVFNALGGLYNSATVISSISVFSGNGNFDAGTVFVYTSVV